MKKYKARWQDGTTRIIKARNRQEARSRLDGWAMLRSNHLPNHMNYSLRKVDNNFDKILKTLLLAMGLIGVWIILCTSGADEIQPMPIADFLKNMMIGGAMFIGSIGIYVWRYENV